MSLTRIAIATIATITLASPLMAAPCRDAHGHFIACPHAVPAAPAPTVVAVHRTVTTKTTHTHTTTARCRDAKGHFAHCGAPGTHPA